MRELERMLSEAGSAIEWPATPDLAARVAAGIDASSADRPRGRMSTDAPAGRIRTIPPIGSRVALAFALLAIAAGGAYAAIPSFRDAIRDFLGVDSVEVERVPRLPAAPERPLVGGLGERMTLAQARETVDFAPRVPSLAGEAQIYAARRPQGGRISFVYPRGSGPPLLITQFRGDVPQVLIQKLISPGTSAERLRIQGDPALWLGGRPHVFLFADAGGEIREERIRMAGPALIWATGGLVVRIEGAATKAEALRIARGLP